MEETYKKEKKVKVVKKVPLKCYCIICDKELINPLTNQLTCRSKECKSEWIYYQQRLYKIRKRQEKAKKIKNKQVYKLQEVEKKNG